MEQKRNGPEQKHDAGPDLMETAPRSAGYGRIDREHPIGGEMSGIPYPLWSPISQISGKKDM